MPYMKKMIYSGKLLEIEKYPIGKKGNKIPRCGKYKVSSDSQAALNEKNAKKNFIRLVECNYTEKDLFITLNYKTKPESVAKFKRDFQNFLRRLKYHCIKNKLPEPVYMGTSHDKSARPHHHIFLNSYSWDFIRTLWKEGRVFISNLERDDEYGFIQVSKYIMNEKNSNSFNKRWCASKNLKRPKIVKKQIKRLNIYKKIEPPKGYKITDVQITDNVFTGTYQYIRCVKLEE